MSRHLAVATPSHSARTGPLSAIRVHIRLFAGVFLAVVAAVTTATVLVPKQYTATAKMIVNDSPAASDGNQKYSSDTIADLIQDGPVVDKVIDTLKLGQTRAELLSRLRVKPVPNTAIINLSATAESPAQAATIANTLSTVFIGSDRDMSGSQATASQSSLRKAAAAAQTTLQDANGALSVYMAESKIEQLQDDEKQAQAQLSSAQVQLAAMPATIAGQQATDVNPASTALQQQLAQTELQLATARRRYTDKHPAVVALEQQRDELQRQIASQPATVAGQVIAVPNPIYQQLSQQETTLRSQIQGDIEQIGQLQEHSKGLVAPTAALPAQTTQLAFLQERVKLASDAYQALEEKYNNALVAANSAVSDVSIVQPADSDNVSVFPSLVASIIAGIAGGLALALLAVGIANATNRRIREDGDAERVLGLPVIAHIPSMTVKNPRALPWLQTVTLEAFLHLCASLRIVGRKLDTHVIVITSPEKGDGKTTIAYHLASAMSRIRSRVLLIDADMRSPSMHLQAKIQNGPGLSEILSGRRSFDQVVVHQTETLDVLTAGTLPPNPVALAQYATLDDLLDLSRERYDYVIIDTTALTPVVDSALIAARADSTALVLSANDSNAEAAAQAVSRLRSLGIDNILGVIMNRTKTKFGDYADSGSPAPALAAVHGR